jgi:hypothetical protein
MVFPLIPIAAAASIICGTITLTWYSRLTPERKKDADRYANKLAMECFRKRLDSLGPAELNTVSVKVKNWVG